MRILSINAVYPPHRSGMSNAAKEAAEGLASRGHEMHVATLALAAQPGTAVEQGVTVHRIAAWPAWGLAGVPKEAFWQLLKEEWDAVLLHLPFFGCQEMLALALAKGWTPKRLVVSYHMDVVAPGFVGMAAQVSRRIALPALLRHADVVMAASQSYAESSWLKAHWQTAAPKLQINAFGVDVERFSPEKKGDAGAPKRICFVGGLDRAHYFKGFAVLLEALLGLKDRDDWTLEVIGDGDLRPGYEAQAQQLGIADRVTFLGGDGDVPALYRRSDLHVLPSLDRSEAFGLVVLEAQASGIPSIVSDLPGVREAIAPETTGLLVRPGDAANLRQSIAALLDDDSRRHRMGEAARQRAVCSFTWSRHLDALEKALSGAGAAPARRPKTLILHDRFQFRGGGERLVLDMARTLDADIATEFWTSDTFPKSEVPHALFVLDEGEPSAIVWRYFRSHLNFWWKTRKLLRQYDTIIFSGNNCLSAALRPLGRRQLVAYCHTPVRYVYDLLARRRSEEPSLLKRVIYYDIGKWFIRAVYRLGLSRMQTVMANSVNVQGRLRRFCNTDSVVVYPPVQTERFRWISQGDYFISWARLDPLKRIDMIVAAFQRMPEKKLVVASGGPEEAKIREMAKGHPNIQVIGWVETYEDLLSLVGKSLAAIYVPVDEDFGITPVEGMAAGKPCIGVDEGGLKETIVPGKTGALLRSDFTVDDIVAAVREMTPARALAMRVDCEAKAQEFSAKRFADDLYRALHATRH